MTPAEIIIGVDAGGTKTRAVAADASGRVVAHLEGQGANLLLTGPEEAANRLLELLLPLSNRHPIRSVVVGIAGAYGAGNAKARLGSLLSQALKVKKVAIMNDAVAMLKGFTLTRPSGTTSPLKGEVSRIDQNRLLLSVGTGAVVFGLDTKERLYRVDGWGPLAGDAG